MIKTFSLTEEAKINKYIAEHANELSANGVLINVKPGECVIQTDNDIEKRSILQAVITAHGQLLSKKLSREADKRFFLSESIKINGAIGMKSGGSGRQDELISKRNEIEKQLNDIENELNLYEHQLKTNTELVNEIKAGKMDSMFV